MTDASWENSTLVHGDVKAELTRLKRELALRTTGSSTLVRWRREQGLVDELHLFLHPVVVGHGTKLFTDGARARSPWPVLPPSHRRAAPGLPPCHA